MIETTAVIKNEAGIHCRPTAIIIQEAAKCNETITITAESGSCVLGSALDIMMLALQQGTEITLQVEGPNEEEVAKKFKDLFETNFDFPDAAKIS